MTDTINTLTDPGSDPAHEWQQPDAVNHPGHYTSHPSGVECIQVTEHMSFCLGNAIKYIWRADLKGNAIEDLQKARWYVDREIARLGGEPADLDRLAADGRLLPEGGTVLTEEQMRDFQVMHAVANPIHEDEHAAFERVKVLLAPMLRAPAVSVQSGGLDAREDMCRNPECRHTDWGGTNRLHERQSDCPVAPIPGRNVHNHGPREGRGLDCPEQLVDGRLRGVCMDSGPDGTPEKPWTRVEEIGDGTWFRPKSMPGVHLSKSGRTGWFVMKDEANQLPPSPRTMNDLAPFVRVDGEKA